MDDKGGERSHQNARGNAHLFQRLRIGLHDHSDGCSHPFDLGRHLFPDERKEQNQPVSSRLGESNQIRHFAVRFDLKAALVAEETLAFPNKTVVPWRQGFIGNDDEHA